MAKRRDLIRLAVVTGVLVVISADVSSDDSEISAWIEKSIGVKFDPRVRIWFEPCRDREGLLFVSGFDDVKSLVPISGGQQLRFTAKRSRPACTSDEKTKIGHSISLGRALIQFQGGDVSERRAEIVDDPLSPGNSVLCFVLDKANVRNNKKEPYKGRVQMNVYEGSGVRYLDLSVDVLLREGFSLTSDYPKAISWLTLSEWWNNPGWKDYKYPFRISVGLTQGMPSVDRNLYFSAKAQTLDENTGKWNEPLWQTTAYHFPVPEGKWMTLKYVFREGDTSSGFFSLVVEEKGRSPVKVIEVNNYTHHPDDPAPDGLTHFNPIKLYTSRRLIEHVRARGGNLSVCWDNIMIRARGAGVP